MTAALSYAGDLNNYVSLQRRLKALAEECAAGAALFIDPAGFAEGTLTIDNVTFTNSSGNYAMKQFQASIINDQLFQKRINANCDFFDFEMGGKMNFNTIATAFKQYVYHYVEIPLKTNAFENR